MSAGRVLRGSGWSSLFFDPIVEEQKGEGKGSDKADGSDCSRGLSGGSAGGSFILHEHHQKQDQNQSSKWQLFWGGSEAPGILGGDQSVALPPCLPLFIFNYCTNKSKHQFHILRSIFIMLIHLI